MTAHNKLDIARISIGVILLISMLVLFYLVYFLSVIDTDSSAVKPLLLGQGLLSVYFLLRFLGKNATYAGMLVKSQGKELRLHGYDFIVFISQVAIVASAFELQ